MLDRLADAFGYERVMTDATANFLSFVMVAGFGLVAGARATTDDYTRLILVATGLGALFGAAVAMVLFQ